MHSAIFVVAIPEPPYTGGANQAWLTFMSAVDRLTNNKPDHLDRQEGVERLAENVWQVNFQKNPAALARLIEAAVAMRFPYKILQLDAAPQWLPVGSNPTPT